MPASKEKEGKSFLMNKMTVLEQMKSTLSGKDEITEETVGQAHCETVAIKLFSWADDQDRYIPYYRCVATLRLLLGLVTSAKRSSRPSTRRPISSRLSDSSESCLWKWKRR